MNIKYVYEHTDDIDNIPFDEEEIVICSEECGFADYILSDREVTCGAEKEDDEELGYYHIIKDNVRTGEVYNLISATKTDEEIVEEDYQ